jgi:hypothetical protein
MNSERQQQIEALAEFVGERVKTALNDACRTCLTCDHFQQAKETCGLNGQRPPAKIIAFGCECYENEIPF